METRLRLSIEEWTYRMMTVQLYNVTLHGIGLPICMIQPHKSDGNAASFHYSILSATQPVSGSDKVSQYQSVSITSVKGASGTGPNGAQTQGQL